MRLLEGRVAVITGAGRGIGRAVDLACSKEGAGLVLVGRTSSKLEETTWLGEAVGATSLAITIDVTDPAQGSQMVWETIERFSTIDILANKAGVQGPIGPLWNNDVASWIRTVEVNGTGVFLCRQSVLLVMLANDRGKIVNIYGGRGHHVSSYGASKVAVADMTESVPSKPLVPVYQFRSWSQPVSLAVVASRSDSPPLPSLPTDGLELGYA